MDVVYELQETLFFHFLAFAQNVPGAGFHITLYSITFIQSSIVDWLDCYGIAYYALCNQDQADATSKGEKKGYGKRAQQSSRQAVACYWLFTK